MRRSRPRGGATSCVDGAVQDSCVAGTGAPTDETCDGVDDDCDGSLDDDYAPEATSCGVGACGRMGLTSCVAGVEQDSCVAGAPAPSDASCNGVDEDCSGVNDEDYVPQATSGGVGACGRTGTTSCVSGAVVDGCTPGVPALDDNSCNGVDEDCDSNQDESYLGSPTSCGVGACAASGTTVCNAGAIQNTCSPGTPGPDDASCNGVDEDCSGAADEDYVVVCASGVALASCVGGSVTPVSCSDGNACTADSCDAGACVHASEILDDGNPCTDDLCDPDGGVTHVPAVGRACTDDDACTTSDACDGTGACVGSVVVVDDGNTCTADACDSITGVSHSPTPGVACNDGSLCTTGELCQGNGSCGGGAVVSCDDGLFCNGTEACSPALGCQAGVAPVVDDGVGCTTDSCDEITNAVVHVAVDAACDDGDVCDGANACEVLLGCVEDAPLVVDDGNPCTADACDPVLGVQHDALPVGTSCGGAQFCDGFGYCLTTCPDIVLSSGTLTLSDRCIVDNVTVQGGALTVTGAMYPRHLTMTSGSITVAAGARFDASVVAATSITGPRGVRHWRGRNARLLGRRQHPGRQ